MLLASELASLEPSPEVLPPVVRQVTTIEWESGRGLALTPVVTPDGKGLYLNWTVYFFAARGVLGKDLDLTTQKVRFSRKRIYAEAKDQITLVVADWDEDLLRLCPPMPEEGLPEDWMKLGWRSWS